MIVFPCHYVGGDLIFRAVEAAQRHMPDEPVLVVDSDSPDRTYMHHLPTDVTFADAHNRAYAPGAFWWAHHHRPADFYYLLHDSLIVRDDLADLRDREVTAVRWWPASAEGGWGWDSDGRPLHQWGGREWEEHVSAPMPPTFQGCFGPMLAVAGPVMDDLAGLGLDHIQAADKFEACALERMWGAALNLLGHDLADGALQGRMGDFFGEYDETRVQKLHPGRM